MTEPTHLTTIQQLISEKYDMPFAELMHKMYVTDDMTMAEMSEVLYVNARTINTWLKQCNIPARRLTWR